MEKMLLREVVDREGHVRHFETQFIEVMLSEIKASLMGMIEMSDEMSDGKMDKTVLYWNKTGE